MGKQENRKLKSIENEKKKNRKVLKLNKRENRKIENLKNMNRKIHKI